MSPGQEFVAWISCKSAEDDIASVTDPPASRALSSLQFMLQKNNSAMVRNSTLCFKFYDWVCGPKISLKTTPCGTGVRAGT